jgi:hypothetical protein
MTWTKLGDDFMERKEMYAVSRDARLLHIEALVWCNKRLTDGRVDSGAVARFTDAEDWKFLVGELEASGAWRPVSEDVWQLDWSDQDDAEDVLARKAARAETQKKYRRRVSAHNRGDHSLCDPRFCPALRDQSRDPSRDQSRDARQDTPPSLPVPARPEGTGTGTEGEGPDRADAPPTLADRHPYVRDECCNLPPQHPVHAHHEVTTSSAAGRSTRAPASTSSPQPNGDTR